MRSDRLISLLLLLQARNPRTARELSGILEVSQRTVYRDVESLSIAGVPIYAERGSTGGIALVDGYTQSLAHLSFDELHALFVSSAHPLADLGIVDSDPALRKLASALPDRQREDARKARSRLLLDQNKWYHTAQPGELLAALRRAVWEDRCVKLEYRDRSGNPTTRTVEALGLVSKAGVWYFIARENEKEPRSFRAERIVSAEILPETFARADFDVATYWQTSISAFERPPALFEALVRVHAAGRPLDMWDAEIAESLPDGVTHRMRFMDEDSALFHATTWGARVEILEPHDLRAATIERAKQLLARYGATIDA